MFIYKSRGEGTTEGGEDTAGGNTERIIPWRMLEEMGQKYREGPKKDSSSPDPCFQDLEAGLKHWVIQARRNVKTDLRDWVS